MKKCWILVFLLLCQSVFAAPVQIGQAYFQTDNMDDTYNPRTAAPTRVSVTTTTQNPNAPQPPYQLRSWLGGMLWGTGTTESDYFVPVGGAWVQQNFQQHHVWASPITLQYSQPPGQAGSDVNSRGVNLLLPFPYLQPDAAYGTCGANWTTAPLLLNAAAFANVLLVPTDTAPLNDVDPVPLPWSPAPNGVLVDRMWDFDADLVLQDPSSPYMFTTNTTGAGTYIKMTQAQGSPYTFVESRGTQYVIIRNLMQVKVATTAAAVVPGVTGVSYALVGGNQNNPGLFAGAASLNPAGDQDNFTTWAIFWKTDQATFTERTTNNTLEWNNTGSSKNYFVIAAIPTVSVYPTTGQTYAAATTAANFNVQAYAEELGKYAFNFITDTAVTYTVTDMYQLTTTYTQTLSNPYNILGMVDGTRSVFALIPHQYQPIVFEASVAAQTVLDLNGSTDFAPTNATSLLYWVTGGNLKTILGTTFNTVYIRPFNNEVQQTDAN